MEVRWVVNERAMIVIAKRTIAPKTVQLVQWSSRKAWVVQACQSGRAPESAMTGSCIGLVPPVRFRATRASTPDRDADCESCVAPDSPNLSNEENRRTSKGKKDAWPEVLYVDILCTLKLCTILVFAPKWSRCQGSQLKAVSGTHCRSALLTCALLSNTPHCLGTLPSMRPRCSPSCCSALQSRAHLLYTRSPSAAWLLCQSYRERQTLPTAAKTCLLGLSQRLNLWPWLLDTKREVTGKLLCAKFAKTWSWLFRSFTCTQLRPKTGNKHRQFFRVEAMFSKARSNRIHVKKRVCVLAKTWWEYALRTIFRTTVLKLFS